MSFLTTVWHPSSFGLLLMRNPFSAEKMTYVADSGKVIYRSEMSHGKHKKNFEVFDANAFIEALFDDVMVNESAAPRSAR